jgi:hypothetical protein
VDDTHDGAYAREPLVRVCRALNEAGARYLLIGGFAVIAFLIDTSTDDVARVKRALRVLEDHAADDVEETDVARYTVVRVADEIVVDLMALAGGIDHSAAAADSRTLTIGGVQIPVASPATLIRTKNTVRPSDAADRRYLEQVMLAEGGQP